MIRETVVMAELLAASDRWNRVRAELEHGLGRPATLQEVSAAVDADAASWGGFWAGMAVFGVLTGIVTAGVIFFAA